MSITGDFYEERSDDLDTKEGGLLLSVLILWFGAGVAAWLSSDPVTGFQTVLHVVSSFLFFLPFIPLIVTIPADFLVGVRNHIDGWWNDIQGFLGSRRRKKMESSTLERLDPSKIEPHISSPLPDLGNATHLKEICVEIVLDQLGRKLVRDEEVYVLSSEPKPGGKVTVVTFVYRRCEQTVEDGVSHDRLVASAHVVRLLLNSLAKCVDISWVTSLTHKELGDLEDPESFVTNVTQRLEGDLLPCSAVPATVRSMTSRIPLSE